MKAPERYSHKNKKILSPIAREKELQQDIVVLRKIFYETFEASIVFQQKAKEQLTNKDTQEKAVLAALMKSVDVSGFVFFNPKEYVDKCFSNDQSEDLLLKIRRTRKELIKLVINGDKVVFKLVSEHPTNLYEQFKALNYLFVGLGHEARKQKNSVRKLLKTVRGTQIKPTSVAPIIENLSKGRLICMFFIKWLALADNDYTDKQLVSRNQKTKVEFGLSLSEGLTAISKSEQCAISNYLIDKLDSIEHKLDLYASDSKIAHDSLKSDLAIVKETCIMIAEKHPEETRLFVESKIQEIKALLLQVEEHLKEVNTDQANQAKKWRRRLERGLGISADIIGLLGFLTGLPSLPTLANSSTAVQAVGILKALASKLK